MARVLYSKFILVYCLWKWILSRKKIIYLYDCFMGSSYYLFPFKRHIFFSLFISIQNYYKMTLDFYLWSKTEKCRRWNKILAAWKGFLHSWVESRQEWKTKLSEAELFSIENISLILHEVATAEEKETIAHSFFCCQKFS